MRNDFKDYRKFEYTEVSNIKILNCINPEENNIKKRIFNAICKCGNPRTVRQYAIVHREKLQCKPCGWKQLGLKKQKPEAGLNNLFLHYVKGAERRNIKFELTKDQVKELTSKNCFYCDRKPYMLSFSNRTWNNRSQYVYNTIDRINSDIHYIFENCTTACKDCNRIKGVLTIEEFKILINKIHNHLGLT